MNDVVKDQERQQENQSKEVARSEQSRHPAYLHPFEEIERLFDAFSRGWLSPWSREWPAWSRLSTPFEGRSPKVDLIDRDDTLVLRAELPGVKKEDVEVTLSEDSLTIRAHSRQEQKEEKENFLRREISYGEFVRTVPLPVPVDVDQAKSKFDNGVLEITLPKVSKARRRVIPVE